MVKSKSFNVDHLTKILSKYNIRIQKLSRFIEAFTHPTYANEHRLNYNYERYEFLGDSAISWVISNYLFSDFSLSEGDMSIIKSRLNSGQTFVKISKELELDKIMLLGNGLKVVPDKIYEDVFEALVGAIAQDSGIKKVANFIHELIIVPYKKHQINTSKPYKTMIQEVLMRSEVNEIVYQPLNNRHEIPRKVNLVFDGIIYGTGEGRTLHDAEEAAAKQAYEKLCKSK